MMLRFLGIVLVLLSTQVMGIDFDAKVPFSGVSAPTGVFYNRLPKMPAYMKLMWGVSSTIPGRKTEELDMDLMLGLHTDVVLFGPVDIYFTFNNHNGVVKTGEYRNSEFYTQSLSLAKTWTYPLNERLELGLTAVLGQVLLNGEYHIRVLPEMYPVLKMKISLF